MIPFDRSLSGVRAFDHDVPTLARPLGLTSRHVLAQKSTMTHPTSTNDDIILSPRWTNPVLALGAISGNHLDRSTYSPLRAINGHSRRRIKGCVIFPLL